MLALASGVAFAAGPPGATSGEATQVAETTVKLTGKVNPDGTAVAACRFEYGTTMSYGAVAPCTPEAADLGAGGLNVPVSAAIDGLEPGTTYHFRLIASNVNGAALGSDVPFATVGVANCGNVARRVEQGIVSVQLPDCMALEQISPARKGSQRAVAPTISADGQRTMFYSLAALANTPGNLSTFTGDIYVATRGEDGWKPLPTSPPPPISQGWESATNLVRNFDPSLSRWVVMGSAAWESDAGVSRLFRGGLGGAFTPISPLLKPIDAAVHTRENVRRSVLQGSSADHTRLAIAMGEASALYLPSDPVPSGSDSNVYLAQLDSSAQPSLKLLARDDVGADAGKAWGETCGARVGGIGPSGTGWRNQGAVSADGSRIYFSTRPTQLPNLPCNVGTGKFRILERTETAGAADIQELFASECNRAAPDPACSTFDGDDFYQGASVDGSKVYFTSNRQLTNSDLDSSPASCSGLFGFPACDLYVYDRDADKLTQVSAGKAFAQHPVVGSGANVFNGTVAISGDGSHAYFVASGSLTDTPNPAGATAAGSPFGPKLYAWDNDEEELEFIGPLSSADTSLWGGSGSFLNAAYPVPATGRDAFGNEVGGAGDILLFHTKAALTANDTDGGRLDTYRFDASGSASTLLCVSCRAGAPDGEPFDVDIRLASVPGVPGTAFAEQGRWVSEDGSSVLVRTKEALVPGDLNESRDDYLWRGGRFTILPGTTPPASGSALGETPPVLSHDGEQVAFTAYSRLLASDIDTAPDVYVARVGGGFKSPPPTETCKGEACQGPPGALPPEPLAVATPNYLGKGNVAPQPAAKCPKGKRSVVRNGVRSCVKPSKPKKKGKSKAKKQATKKQGGRK